MLLHCLSNDGQETAVIFMEARQAIPTFLSFIKDTTTKKGCWENGPEVFGFSFVCRICGGIFSNEIKGWQLGQC